MGDLGGEKGGRDVIEREKRMKRKMDFECFNLGEQTGTIQTLQ